MYSINPPAVYIHKSVLEDARYQRRVQGVIRAPGMLEPSWALPPSAGPITTRRAIPTARTRFAVPAGGSISSAVAARNACPASVNWPSIPSRRPCAMTMGRSPESGPLRYAINPDFPQVVFACEKSG